MRILTLIFVILLFLGSCSSASRKTQEYDTGKTKVRVENRNAIPMTIYVLKRSQRIRIGRVAAHETGVFSIPDDIVGSTAFVRLIADPVGSNRSPISEEFTVSPGDVIEMVIRAF
ncbi:hypothetical protein IH879_14520 [candidate division KSB1 bacterium]|nr:hypothetical protein [candidate division KSB1 bacterium]